MPSWASTPLRPLLFVVAAVVLFVVHVPAEAEEALALPAAEALQGGRAGGAEQEQATRIKLGEKLALDHLGPLVIQKDGTAKRIANWEHLSAQERESTLRIVGKRNRERVEALKSQLGDEL